MAYTEDRNVNGRTYYYRVLSVRKGKKISKKRVYLGYGLSETELSKKEREADKQLIPAKTKRINSDIENIKSQIIKILKKNYIVRAGIFGSYARGDAKKNSDIDIAVQIKNKNISLIGFIKIIRILEETLKRKVDLVEYSEIKPRIKERILREEIRII
ncbi:nucleotidyltransferase family protein [Candidatus Woesearchaeota archaeon]|nr:nucleotidyltransferase family protein [Candidatus Woesearchaeota archaeon]